MKSESLVIVDQNATVNTFRLVHTARHNHGVAAKEVGSLTFRGGRSPLCGSWLGWSRNKVALGEPGGWITSLYEDIHDMSTQIDTV